MKTILYLLFILIDIELSEPSGNITIQLDGQPDQLKLLKRNELQTIIRALMHEYLKEEGM